ncbi:uncharacterized protein LOC100844293 isoform X4 [Brachypodium distachyon]|uniref:Uncharacterized protein n=1 Tax=Brachypodium distachyon TaxID=15368 RepID=A0A0Q3FKK6_BRADI|nr:uncharacterized protein LOC100844293 isoform X4 [Brachypodium distachyon]KQJ98708.1 hypothetical protein BRADI_3g38560v3 [Brachypodium distachyon]|eukprot:XP_010235234.1 uncharacterized protein LOC100844293 isoform X4 [Brachypodium distachyon]
MATAVASQPRHLPLGAGGDPRTTMCAASTSKIYTLEKVYGFRLVCRSVVDPRSQKLHPRIYKRKCYLRSSPSECEKIVYSARWLEFRRQRIPFQRSRRPVHNIPLASQDDGNGVSVNGAPQVDPASQMEEMRVKLDKALQNEDISTGLVQSIHDAARSIELAFLDHSKSSNNSWFPKTWLGVDNNAWIKSLSYQAAVGSLLQAVIDVSSRGNGRDRDINVFVQRSLSRLLSSLDGVIQNELAKREPTLYQWYSSNQNPLVVRTFVNTFENDPRFNSATAICCEGKSANTSESDLSLLTLGLFCLAAITKLGSAKVSCQQFFSMVPDIIGRFMDMLLEFVPISKAYTLMKDIGLQREFLCNFGPRAAVPKFTNDHGLEISFWIDLVQKQLLKALDREKIWSRLTTSESIEVLEKDLAIFGFFIALGRSTQVYLSSKRITDSNDSINGVVRYLIGGSVLYYPQLSSISSYQLYVEVVCEELEWFPFYYEDVPTPTTDTEDREEMPKAEVLSRVLNVCSYWMTSFIKYSSWLENPSNVKAARFLSKGHAMLSDRMNELDVAKNNMPKDRSLPEPEELVSGTELASFDKADASGRLLSPAGEEGRGKASSKGTETSTPQKSVTRMENKNRPFWDFFGRTSGRKMEPAQAADQDISAAKVDNRDKESNDILRFEQLRRELIELEKRVQKSADDAKKEEFQETTNGSVPSPLLSVPSGPASKKDNVITKSVEKVKESTTIVLQGTQLLAIDTGAAMDLLRRSLIGDELTQKEKQALQRTLTDLASVVPIGILMLLPVTAVGHAAILAFIQRYVPSMIPSTYGPERLDLLRQLEKVKEMEVAEGSSEVMSEVVSSRGDRVK